MYIPSVTTILGGVFFAYLCHSMWQMAQLFNTIKCTHPPCYNYFLNAKPKLQLTVFSSAQAKPVASEVSNILSIADFNYAAGFERDLEIFVPLKTRRNGTLHLHVVLALSGAALDWNSFRRDGPTVVYTVRASEYKQKDTEAFKLLGGSAVDKNDSALPITHLRKVVYITLLTDEMSFSEANVPGELIPLIRLTPDKRILPILRSDFVNTRLQDLSAITRKTDTFQMKFVYTPIGTGRLRLMQLIEQTVGMITQLGFTAKDLDEVKGMFSGTNLYILLCTVFVSGVHLLFDFLSFKHDISFWRGKKSFAGLSMRTTLWRTVSQIIIFFYLMDNHTSLLVLIPAGLSALIELWKCMKFFKLQGKPSEPGSVEQLTTAFDQEGMRYLSYLLYPLCICYAIYSLIYMSHRSWWSWTLQSLVNGVYAFGFLFMLPQLFINYKLKSVAALPWRSFMYKAFNTFIDDFFAFIISMPTMHRVACLRDDIVFLIYLYQRWLYPVDKNRIDHGSGFEQEIAANEDDKNDTKKTK